MLEQLYRWLNLSEPEQDTLIKQLDDVAAGRFVKSLDIDRRS